MQAKGQNKSRSLDDILAKLEISNKGRIGLWALNTETMTSFGYRDQERFPMCSTFKFMLGAAILKKGVRDPGFLSQKLIYKESHLVSYSPVTKKHVKDGMTISELCQASITMSDNTATNLLLEKLGGLKAINVFARSIGDQSFRLDRLEPELNTAIPGDHRDTSTPEATGKSLHLVALGNILPPSQRATLQDWLKNNKTGDARIRAGVPKAWSVGDKTGTCDYGTTNDVGIIWPTRGSPIVIVVYFTQLQKEADPRNEIIAAVTTITLDYLSRSQQ